MSRLLAMHVFERVANEGGFAAAARSLNMSPSAVTRHVAELESHLGTRLFQRTTRRVHLTDAGEVYLARIQHILQDIEEADAQVSAHTNALAGRLRVYAPPALSYHVIAPVLGDFCLAYPDIRVEIQVGAEYALPIEDFDITLLGNSVQENANIVARKIVQSEVILVASPDYAARHPLPQHPTELSQHRCLRLRDSDRLENWIFRHPEKPDERLSLPVDPVIVANHTDTLLRATLNGVGITSVVLSLAAPYLNRGELVRVLHPWSAGEINMYAALPSRKHIPQRSLVFLDYLINHTRQQHAAAKANCTAC
ncbi:LysR family transcriptional regulator [Paenalcaligenes sp. Me131]|uniref:LysR family transcriptional regulator n=1 Tax=Paenalcaligenes sp. Me131 TaxID=3392636 RepID=UPI003D2D247A